MKQFITLLFLTVFFSDFSCLNRNENKTNESKIDSINQIVYESEYYIDSLLRLVFWQQSVIDSLKEIPIVHNRYDCLYSIYVTESELKRIESEDRGEYDSTIWGYVNRIEIIVSEIYKDIKVFRIGYFDEGTRKIENSRFNDMDIILGINDELTSGLSFKYWINLDEFVISVHESEYHLKINDDLTLSLVE